MSREQYGESRRAPSLRVVPAALSQLIPSIRHVVDEILPRRHVTLLGGHGGSGKSILALILAAHCAAGRDWGGLSVIQTRTLVVTLEDPADLVRLRLRRIVTEYGLPADMITSGITIADGTDGACLAHETTKHGTRHLAMTAAYDDLHTLAAGHGLIIIDNASDAYAASENDRRMVREFMAGLARIARQQDAAVLLLAHIDKTAARYGAIGNSYSGSTAWHNSARSRLALVDTNGRLELHHEKANLGPRIDPIPLDWTSAGVLIPATGRTVSHERDAADDDEVLAAIRAAIADGAHVPAARTGPATTLHVLCKYPDLPKHFRVTDGRKRFWDAITRLQRAGRHHHAESTQEDSLYLRRFWHRGWRNERISRHRLRRKMCAHHPPIPPCANRRAWAPGRYRK
jgi:KaiC/GvpD/RAD55 family RecA-like ATPase